MELSDEIEALQSIYSNKDEFEVSKDKDGNPILCFQLASENVSDESQSSRSKVSLSVILPNAYPSVAPRISISSNDLKREAQNSLTSSATEFSKTLPAEPMVMDIVCWVQEHLQEYIQENDLNDQHTTRFNQADQNSFAVLHIDHMRAKQRYLKTLINWADAGHILGRVIFCHRLIFVILVGSGSSIKDFILNLKTQTVDVDSCGRNCKEKMMSVISEGTLQNEIRESGFETVDCNAMYEVEEIFKDFSLENIFRISIRGYFPTNMKDSLKR
ncbi:RWD domain-containing protein 3-like [Apostichopus japonicus]|uniref:RWD domain-containing protein 3-like n=1 Tax=Stichopus japonicus TaxID=307972 RepID=UPI003AB3391E